MAEKELVDHPAHYGGKDDPYEHVKVAEALGWVNNAFVYNCTKYIWRCGRKDGAPTLRDLQKAAWYLDREIKRLEQSSLYETVLATAAPEIDEDNPHGPSNKFWPTGKMPVIGEIMGWHDGSRWEWKIFPGGRKCGWCRLPGDQDRLVPRQAEAK